MEKLVYYFEHIASWQRSLAIVLGIVFFWVLEGVFPLIHFRYNKVRHAGLNLFFTATTVAVNLLFAYFIVLGSNYTNSHHIRAIAYRAPSPLVVYALWPHDP